MQQPRKPCERHAKRPPVGQLNPTTYLVDGQPRQMKSQQVTVQARRPDGPSEKDLVRGLPAWLRAMTAM